MRRLVLLVIAGFASVVLVTSGCSDAMSEALALEKDGEWDAALEIYREALEDSPDDLDALNGLAAGLWLLGRYDEALPYQEEVVAADPDDLTTRLELAFNYLNHQGRELEAVGLLERARTLEESGRVLTYLGLAWREAGDLYRAEESFREAMAVEPGYGLAYYELVGLLEEAGRMAESAMVREAAKDQGVDLGEVL